jgi:Tfp pilus assembly protein PilE
MESTKTSRGFLVAVLLVAVCALTALNIYQDHVIKSQRYELRWLMTHSVIRPETIAADLARNSQGKGPQTPPASVAQLPPAAKPAAPPAAKP